MVSRVYPELAEGNHEPLALRRAQGEREKYHPPFVKQLQRASRLPFSDVSSIVGTETTEGAEIAVTTRAGDRASSAQVDARFFRGLSDPTRLILLETLLDLGEMNVASMTAALGLSRSRIATHLACLRSCGYVTARREGRFLYYAISDPRVKELLALARSISSEHGDALACCQIIEGFTAELLLTPPALRPLPARWGRRSATPRQPEASADLSFGAWLGERMRQQGLSARDLAGALRISAAAVSRWLYRGGLPLPSVRPRLAEALWVSADEVRQRTQSLRGARPSAFATWLDQQLQQRDWTRAELARRLKLEPHSVVSWFRRGARPRRTSLEKLAALLAVAPSSIPPAPE
ncbi:MAG: metalloregulator ArsR/SmtB family transcription factor [Chloroflexi bacterium]|nr:metalloregulator ArsR/SmtB family transcription factor [Chloroflexota bacterium]